VVPLGDKYTTRTQSLIPKLQPELEISRENIEKDRVADRGHHAGPSRSISIACALPFHRTAFAEVSEPPANLLGPAAGLMGE
jgi:MOSC domain-containing protein YiiM